MVLAKQHVSLRFGKRDARSSPRKTLLGTLTEALNVRELQLGRYQKRLGYSRLDKTCDTGSITVGSGLAATPDALVMHADDGFRVRDAGASLWRSRGTVPRVIATDVAGVNDYGSYPTIAISGTKVYVFAGDPDSTSAPIYYRIIDLATGIEIQPRTALAGVSSVTNSFRMRAATMGGYVWLFFSSSSTVVKVAKFDPATPSVAPTQTTYCTQDVVQTSVWDIVSTVNGVAFAMFGVAGGISFTGEAATDNLWISYLSTTTGLPNASPGWVHSSPMSPAGSPAGPMAWANYDGTSGFLYLVVNGAAGAANNLKFLTVDATTLVATVTVSQTALPDQNDRSLCGYRAVSGSVVTFFISDGSDGAGATGSEADIDAAAMTYYLFNNIPGTAPVAWKQGCWAASEPFLVGSTYYIITGYDDTDNLQRTYTCRNASTGAQVGEALQDRGGNIFQRGVHAPGVTVASNTQKPTQVVVSGNKAYMALCQYDDVGQYQTRFVTWDFAATYAPIRPFMNSREIFYGGGTPVRVSAVDGSAIELVPTRYPPTPTITTPAVVTSLAAGTYGIIHTYMFRDGLGNTYRSARSPAVSAVALAGDAIDSVVANFRHYNGNMQVWIETWMTQVDGSKYFLASRTLSDPLTATTTIRTESAPADGAEEIYTVGGNKDNEPAPPCRFAFEWRNRLFLGGTDFEGEVWPSKEFKPGSGPEFHSDFVVAMPGGSGSLYAGAAVSHDYAAFFKGDAIFVISGSGPDDAGNGNYSPIRLNTEMGTRNAASVVTGPDGVYFQAVDGGIWRVGLDLQVVYIGGGVQDYVSSTIVASLNWASRGWLMFWTSAGKILVLDYGNATEENPLPWKVHESTDFGTPVGACVFGDTVHWLQSDGVVRKEVAGQFYDGSSVAYQPKCTTAPIQFGDLGGAVRISRIQFVGEFVAAHTMRMSVALDGGTATNFDKAVTATPERFEARPSGAGNVGEVVVTVQQSGNTTTDAFYFDGLGFEVQPRSRKVVNTTQRI